jgi:hypothetical protein
MERNDLFVFLVEFGASWNLRVGFIAAEKVAGLQTLSLAIGVRIAVPPTNSS